MNDTHHQVPHIADAARVIEPAWFVVSPEGYTVSPAFDFEESVQRLAAVFDRLRPDLGPHRAAFTTVNPAPPDSTP